MESIVLNPFAFRTSSVSEITLETSISVHGFLSKLFLSRLKPFRNTLYLVGIIVENVRFNAVLYISNTKNLRNHGGTAKALLIRIPLQLFQHVSLTSAAFRQETIINGKQIPSNSYAILANIQLFLTLTAGSPVLRRFLRNSKTIQFFS